MNVAGARYTISTSVPFVATTAATSDELASHEGRSVWDRFINESIIEWGRRVAIEEDDGFVWPSRVVLSMAFRIARDMRDAGDAPPDRVVPDGDGGVSFERRHGRCFESIDIREDEVVEALLFCDGSLTRRTSSVFGDYD